MEHKVIANYSLLVSVKGSNMSLKPYLIASHFDVVPATNESWEVPPFEGRVQDGYFWGRGTLDVKNGVMVCAVYKNFIATHNKMNEIMRLMDNSSIL